MINQNYLLWLLSLLHRFSAFFPPKTGGRWDSSTQISCKSCQRWVTFVGCSVLIFQSSSSHINSMGFKFADCSSQDISWRICCSSLLLIYLWQSLPVCFRLLFCMSTNPWSTSCVSDVIVWCSMFWLPVWFNFPFTWCKSLTLQLVKPHIP